MSKITDIATLINLTLEAGTLSSKRFQKGDILGLAELMKKEGADTTYPAIIDINGEGTEVMQNDKFPFQVYHRIIEIVPSVESADTYGDGDTKIETTQMKMVVFANRRTMQFELDDLITAINVGFPVSLSKTQLATLGSFFSQIDFEVTGFDLDKQAVWVSEFGSEAALPTYSQVFAVSYKVQSHIMAGCYEIC